MEMSNDGATMTQQYIEQANKLSDEALTREGQEADRLFESAYQKYVAAMEIDPNESDIPYNWGIALADQARTKDGEDMDRLFSLAYEKYAAAAGIEPRDYEILHNWGVALMDHGDHRTGEQADKLYAEAEEKFIKADTLSSDLSAYVLASLYASEGKEEQAREWLNKAYLNGDLEGLVDRETVEEDPRFESVRDAGWFQEIISKL